MAIDNEPPLVGQALMVQGTVKVESKSGVSRVIEPNSQLFLDDKISTGSNGSVSIVLHDYGGTQLDLGRMNQAVIDEDVAGSVVPDLVDVTLEADLAAELLHNWEATDPAPTLEKGVAESAGSNTEETASTDYTPQLDSSSVVPSGDGIDENLGSIDEDLDLTHFIPPPEDAS